MIAIAQLMHWSCEMTAIIQTLSHFSHAETKTELLKIVATLCGAELGILFLFATYGLDLSPGFF
jgi:hypothetical protein